MEHVEVYLDCEVSPGMHSGEQSVIVRDLNGEVLNSGFFDRSFISMDDPAEKRGRLRVSLLAKRGNRVKVDATFGESSGCGFYGANKWVPRELITLDNPNDPK